MTDDLKHYRASYSPWPWIIAAAFVVAYLAVVGPMDYADRLDAQAELALLRTELAALRHVPRSRPAPLGVNCAPRQWYADQPDGARGSCGA